MAKIPKAWIHKFEKYLAELLPTVLNQVMLHAFFNNLMNKYDVPFKLNCEDFIDTFTNSNKIEMAKINHVGNANPQKTKIIRYFINSPSPFTIGLSLRSKSYLSHSSALFLNGLSEQIPGNIYVNKEQSKKIGSNELTQAGIDQAFKNKVRQSNYIWSWKEYRYTLLNGKNTGDYGVVNIELETGEKVRVTDIERTLVDVVVRPAYSGGTNNLIEIYRRANGGVSAKQIIRTLKKLDYIYPYHQSIGFLMERAGFDKSEYEQLKKLGTHYDFYLDHKIKNKKYDNNWRIYYPREFDS